MDNKDRNQQADNTAEELQQSGGVSTEPTTEGNTSIAGLQSAVSSGRSATDRLADSTKSGMSGGTLDGQVAR